MAVRAAAAQGDGEAGSGLPAVPTAAALPPAGLLPGEAEPTAACAGAEPAGPVEESAVLLSPLLPPLPQLWRRLFCSYNFLQRLPSCPVRSRPAPRAAAASSAKQAGESTRCRAAARHDGKEKHLYPPTDTMGVLGSYRQCHTGSFPQDTSGGSASPAGPGCAMGARKDKSCSRAKSPHAHAGWDDSSPTGEEPCGGSCAGRAAWHCVVSPSCVTHAQGPIYLPPQCLQSCSGSPAGSRAGGVGGAMGTLLGS